MFKREMNFQKLEVHRDPQGRCLFIKGKLDSVIYASNENQIPFLRQTFMVLRGFVEGPVIVGGDFNYVANLAKDRSHYCINRTKNFTHTSLNTPLHSLLEEFMLVDVWRWEHPQERDYTYFPPRHFFSPHAY